MTERLSQLLQDEAAQLDTPPAPTRAILDQGRRTRRRRSAGTALAGVGAIAATTAVVVAINGLGGEVDSAPDPAGGSGEAVYAVGATVYTGDGTTASVDDTAIKSMYYTAEGVVVRHGDNAYSDGGGAQRFSVVGADGTVSRLGLVTEETVHASDSDQSLIAYGENVDGRLFLVLYDVSTDAEARRIELGPSDEGWFPVALDDTTAYLQDGYAGTTYAVDLTDGSVTRPTTAVNTWEVAGGRTLTEGRRPAVVDVATGETLVELPKDAVGDLSPDGRFVLSVQIDPSRMRESVEAIRVHDLDSGESVAIAHAEWDLTWARSGDLLFAVQEDGTLTECVAATGDCASSEVEIPPAAPEECFTETTGTGRDEVIESWCEGGTIDIIPGAQTRES